MKSGAEKQVEAIVYRMKCVMYWVEKGCGCSTTTELMIQYLGLEFDY